MISEALIQKWVEEKIVNTNYFIVELTVSSSNQIRVEIDGDDGVKITDCVGVSRAIEGQLDREVEDFELTVSSAGMDKPLRVLRQYQRYIGREVKVSLNDGTWYKGELLSADENEVKIETVSKEKVEGKKKKQIINKTISVPMEELNETRVVITFK